MITDVFKCPALNEHNLKSISIFIFHKNNPALKNIGVIYGSKNPWPNIPVMAVLSVTSPTKRIAPGGTHYNLYIQRQGTHPEEKMFLGEAIIYPQLPIVRKLCSSLRSTTHTTNTPEKRHCYPMTLTHCVDHHHDLPRPREYHFLRS
jgi:hypothetical protein